MTNILVENITYLTIDEVKDSSSLFDSKEDQYIQAIVRQAERIIDSIIGNYGTKQEENKKTLFPIQWEDIPLEIKQATLLLSECLLKKQNNTGNRIIKSEKRRGNTITYDVEPSTNKYSDIHPCIDESIYTLLQPYLPTKIESGSDNFFRT